VRSSGLVDSACGLLPHGHLCWAFTDRGDYQTRAGEYIMDALAAGQWVQYVGAGSRAELRGELDGLAGRTLAEADGVGVSTLEEFHGFGGGNRPVDPQAAVAALIAGTERALAAGYPGFRMVAECTAAVRTPEQREMFARFEYVIDHQISLLPASALCAYDAVELGAAVAELTCLHPYARTGSTLFRLYAQPGAECALAGEIDLSCAELFATTLTRTIAHPVAGRGPELIIDCTGLDFIDHRAVIALADTAHQTGHPLILRTAGHSNVARLVEILDAPDLRVEPIARPDVTGRATRASTAAPALTTPPG
jgi:anti-anti-sigma regulatory factor